MTYYIQSQDIINISFEQKIIHNVFINVKEIINIYNIFIQYLYSLLNFLFYVYHKKKKYFQKISSGLDPPCNEGVI